MSISRCSLFSSFLSSASAQASRKILSLVLAVALTALAGCAGGASGSKLIGRESPPYTPFFMLDAEPIILEHFRGKNVVLVFWASTCNQSQQVIDDINAYVAKYGKVKNVEAIAVSIDKLEDLPKLRERIKWGNLTAVRHSFSGNDIYDQAKVAYEVEFLPSVFMIDPQGKVVAGGSGIDVVKQTLGP